MTKDIISVQVKEVLSEESAEKLIKKLAHQQRVGNMILIGVYGAFLYGVYKGWNRYLSIVEGDYTEVSDTDEEA